MTQPDPSAPGAGRPATRGDGHDGTGRIADAVPARGLRAAASTATVRAVGLLPVRLFLGATYVYAGIDKLANPHFLATGDMYSIGAQMAGYARNSPLEPLINAFLPAAVQIGFLIALAELAVGIGLLTGLAFRLAAGAGACLSLLFWLTATWSINPYFFSPDLPYGFGLLTLALTGHGGVLVWSPISRRAVAADAEPVAGGQPEARVVPSAAAPAVSRRSILRVGLLAVVTFAVAALSVPLRALGYGVRGPVQAASAVTTPAPATPAPATPTAAAPATTTPPSTSLAPAEPSATATASAAPATAAATPSPTAAAGPVIGSMADFGADNGIAFTVPNEVPFAMGPGGPGIMVELADGSVVAYSAVCTHGHCTVGFDQTAKVIACPCHLATYDPANAAAVLSGPAPLPLPAIPVEVDSGGQIHVTASA